MISAFRKVWPGKLEVCVLNGRVSDSEANVILDIFETHKSIDVKCESLSGHCTLQLGIPYCDSEKSTKLLIEHKICKCIEKVLEIGLTTIGVNLDQVKTWDHEGFVYLFLHLLKGFATSGSGWDIMRLTFCSLDPNICKKAEKVCDKYVNQLQMDQSEGAMGSSFSTSTARPSEYLTVKLIEGALEDATVDVIACTVGSFLDLDSSAASKSLNKTSGNKLQRELERKYREKPLTYSDIAVVGSFGNLKCKDLLLGALSPVKSRYTSVYDTDKKFYESNVHNFMTRCFEMADELGHTSIAFPAIGAGGLGYPTEIVAEQMYASASLFQPKRKLTKVVFVIYHTDTKSMQVFRKTEEKQKPSLSSKLVATATAEVTGAIPKNSFTSNSKLSQGGSVGLPPTGNIVEKAVVEGMSEIDFNNFKFLFGEYIHPECNLTWRDGNLFIKGTKDQIALIKENWNMGKQNIHILKRSYICMSSDVYKALQSKIVQRCQKDNINSMFIDGCVCICGEKQTLLDNAKRDIAQMEKQACMQKSVDAGKVNANLSGKSSYNEKLFSARPKDMVSSQKLDLLKDVSMFREFKTSEGMKVYVYKCDLLKTTVDCIVNAANALLEHYAGVAFKIATRAGPSIIEEGRRILKEMPHKCLDVGEVCFTKGGHLQYQFIIHAVGPLWSDYSPFTETRVKECEHKMYTAVLNSLRQAEKLGMKSVAIPSISSGLFGVPKQMCAVGYARAIQDYSKLSQTPLQEVHFVDLDDDMVELIQETFHIVLAEKSSPASYNIMDFVKKNDTAYKGSGSKDKLPPPGAKESGRFSGENVAGKVTKEPSNKPLLKLQIPTSHSASAGAGFFYEGDIPGTKTVGLTYYLSPSQILHVYSADLLGSNMPKVDMLVCSDHVRGTETGYLVKTVRDRAGKKYAVDKDKAFSKSANVKEGDVVVFNGGSSGYQWICVVVLNVFDPKTSKDLKKLKIKEMYAKIFRAAVSNKCNSIALSALGTGSGHAKPETSISHFADGLVEFCKQLPSVKISVHYVNYDMEISKTAKKVLAEKFNLQMQHVGAGSKSSPSRSPFSQSVNPSRSPGAKVNGRQSVYEVPLSKQQMSKSLRRSSSSSEPIAPASWTETERTPNESVAKQPNPQCRLIHLQAI